uniref:SLX9 ribosome biosis factor n=1 Tax=Leptobrachium leishanense TaxID=445787 RepID=A0A8C5PAF6_9ANUR
RLPADSVSRSKHRTVPGSDCSAERRNPSGAASPLPGQNLIADCGVDSNFFSSDVFATTKIDLEHVTKTLDVDSQSIVSVKKEKKTLVPKKEKAKQRRERWLQKIETLTVARQKVKAQVKRRATPVVGDMQPLVDALPELSELTTVRKPRAPRNQPRGVVKKKPEPTNYSKMRPAQKRKITEDEVSRMQELIKNPSFKANPLAAVRQHLLKRMREEQEENLS